MVQVRETGGDVQSSADGGTTRTCLQSPYNGIPCAVPALGGQSLPILGERNSGATRVTKKLVT